MALNRKVFHIAKGVDNINEINRNKIYRSTRWKHLSSAYIKANPFCQICGNYADAVHHIIWLKYSIEKAYDWDNLLSVCKECHARIHLLEISDDEVNNAKKNTKDGFNDYCF